MIPAFGNSHYRVTPHLRAATSIQQFRCALLKLTGCAAAPSTLRSPPLKGPAPIPLVVFMPSRIVLQERNH
jgi:hypothetical protein